MEKNCNEENEVYYGILMNKKTINDGIYAFVPNCLLKGYIEKEGDSTYFYDEVENYYYCFDDSNVIYTDAESVIGYIISEKDMIKHYSSTSLKEAKMSYLDEIMVYTHIGVFDEINEKIKILKMSFHSIEQELNNGKETKLKKGINGNIEENEDINIKNMKEFFDKKIIGQEEAKKDIISAIIMNRLSDESTNKNKCLLVGPTGSGKTLIAETVSEYFNVPMVSIDVTQLSAPGYVGANIEDFLLRLLNLADGNIDLAEKGIVVLDEIDKKGSEKNSDVSGRAVLNVLLPFLQGTTYDIKYNNTMISFNTANLTIFATGAFTEVAESKNKESKNNYYKNINMGFNSTSIDNNKEKQDIKYDKFEVDDFVKYGNMPIELMGRFSTITQLTGHTLSSLKSILINSNISPLLSEKEKLSKRNIKLEWTEDYIEEVAKHAIKLKTGGRSLKNIVEKSIKEVRWEALINDIYSAIILTGKTVYDNTNCILLDKKGKSIQLKDISKNQKAKTLTKKNRG